MKKLLLATLIAACCAASASAAPAEKKIVRVVSAHKYFTVYGPTHQDANWIASQSEDFRARLLDALGWPEPGKETMEIILSPSAKKTKRTYEIDGAAVKSVVTVPAKGDLFWDNVAPEIIRHQALCCSGVRDAGAIRRYADHIPAWLTAGVACYVDPRTAPGYANSVRSDVLSGRFLPVGELFAVRERLRASGLGAAFANESAALVAYLLRLERGKERFGAYVSLLNGDEGWKCVFEDMYYDVFKTDDELDAQLRSSLRNPRRISLNAPRMGMSESVTLLNDAFETAVVSQAGVRAAGPYIEDFAAFKQCCKEEIARRKLMAAYPVLIKLKFEGSEMTQGVVEKYLQAYIMNRDRKKFWKAFVDAENARRKIAPDAGTAIAN